MMFSRKLLALGAAAFSAAALSAAIWPLDYEAALFQVPPAGQPEVYTGKTDVPGGTGIAFDSKNRPVIFNGADPESYGYISVLEDGKWVKRSFMAALEKAMKAPIDTPTIRHTQGYTRISFDAQDNLYILVAAPRKVKDGVDLNGNMVLLYSPDYGKTFHGVHTGLRPYLAGMESSSSGKVPQGPPAIYRGKTLVKSEGSGVSYPGEGLQPLTFSSENRLDVIFPEISANGIKLGKSVWVTNKAVGICSHSGGANIGLSDGDKFFISYAEVPKDPATGANPTYVAEIDRTTGKTVKKQFVTYAMPQVSDAHSIPTLSMDSAGALTVITGSHGWSPIHPGFLAVTAKNPRDVSKWGLPHRIGNGQSYVSTVIDSKDNLYIAYRVHPQLWVQKYDRASGKWLDPVRLLEYEPARNPDGTCGYTVFYHHIYVDRQDNIYVKALFNDFVTGAKGKFPLMWFVSRDGGATWEIAQTDAMNQAITQ